MPANGSEADVKQLTFYPVSIASYKVSKTLIAFSTESYLLCGDDLQCTANQSKIDDERTAYVYDSLFVRHWDEWKVPGKLNQIFLQRIQLQQDGYALVGSPKNVLKGFNANAPVPPFGDSQHYDISPNENQIAFTAALVAHNQSWSTGWRTYTTEITGSFSNIQFGRRTLISRTEARTESPVYSKSGNLIAYLAMTRPGHEADRLHIVTYNVATGETINLSQNLDISFSSVSFTKYDDILFGDHDYLGAHVVSEIRNVNNVATFKVISGEGSASAAAVSKQGKVVFARSSFTSAKDIFVMTWDRDHIGSVVQVTDENPGLAATYGLTAPEKLVFHSVDRQVEGYLFRPYNQQPGVKYPVVQLIHGGPEQSWNNVWGYGWNPQLWAAQGYAVLQVNPRGSTGYGQNFTDAVRGDWGGKPFQDIINGLKYISRYEWVDTTRAAACGGSYGGYMVNWIAGQTQAYKALVNHDGLFDTTDLYYSTDELWFPEWQFHGTPWQSREIFEKWNPRNHVHKWKTPMLVIQGDKDFRVVNTQALGAFTALQRLGIKSRLLFFPNENHWVLDPSNSLQWYGEIFNWIKAHIDK